jgi:hypothetical protein
MNHSAVVTRIRTRPHPNADRLKLGVCLGYQVVVGLDTQDGDLGLYFNNDLQLSKEFAEANNLIAKPDGSGGYFSEKRRVRMQRFRGERSDGFWIPLSSLEHFGDTSRLKEGDELVVFNGVKICSKYFTEGTALARKGRKARGETRMFRKHFDTDQLQRNVHEIKPGDRVITTLKMHGTSGRVGHVLDEVKLPWWKRPFFPKVAWKYLVGTRNVILGEPTSSGVRKFPYRYKAAQQFVGRLHKGETVYFEIVGYESPGKPIMPAQSVKEKWIKRNYPGPVVYHYGEADGDSQVYVYRITQSNEDGYTVELPWEQVKKRCVEMGALHVMEAEPPFHYCGDSDRLVKWAKEFCEGKDPIGKDHPREGICLRVEGQDGKTRIFKQKSFTFGVLEGYLKSDDSYIDPEEVA